jgi:hypothetical protein
MSIELIKSKENGMWYGLDSQGCTTQDFATKEELEAALGEEAALMEAQEVEYPCLPVGSPVEWI